VTPAAEEESGVQPDEIDSTEYKFVLIFSLFSFTDHHDAQRQFVNFAIFVFAFFFVWLIGCLQLFLLSSYLRGGKSLSHKFHPNFIILLICLFVCIC
jgi:hypothetical protein